MKPKAAEDTWARRFRFGPWLVPALFAVVLYWIHREAKHVDLAAVKHALQGLSADQLIAAAAVTVASYLVLTGFDALALRHLGRPLSYARTALASFTGYVFNMNLGLSLLGSATVRYRLYSLWGLGAAEIAIIVGFCAATTGLGLVFVGGCVLVAGDFPAQVGPAIAPGLLRGVGVALLAIAAGYVLACARWRQPLRLRSWQVTLPTWRVALLQIALATTDLALAGTVLFVLSPAQDVAFATFLGVYLTAVVGGLISHVPGGLGVFEGIFLFALPTQAPTAEVLAALVAFRAVYYLLPFAAGVLLVAGSEVARYRKRVAQVASGAMRSVASVAPRALAFAVFLGGLLLLASGATPAERDRLHSLRELIPLPVLEVAHFFGSVAGACLLFLARGLQRRLNAAWHVTGALLAAGIVFSLAKGFDWEEATILAVMLAALAVSRPQFYRRSSLWDQRFTPGWLIAIGLALIGSVWLGFFAFKHVEYSNDLWWHFAWHGDAPRFLRATVGVAGVTVVMAVANLLRHPRGRPGVPGAGDLDQAAALAAQAPDSRAWLGVVGDKALLFSDRRNAFLMYGVAGRNWVAMGDPVGDEDEARELAWRFRELSDAHGGWTVFYEASAARLPLYVELGLALFKIGEEGRVPLRGFSLEGSARKNLRATRARVEREGCSFALWAPDEVRARLPELRAISDDWMRRKQTREKGFSLGRFDAAYLARLPVAVVLRAGRPVAFANLWVSGQQEEISIDLMRYSADAPPNVMEFLFIHLLLHGAAQGFAWFNLGMAPLSGIESHPLAPLWNRVGAVIFRHGEHFYNFAGLRQYKEKFDPVWQPRYLACPGGWVLPRVLTGVASLISGGVIGIVRR